MKQTLLALLIDNSGNIAKKGDTFVQGVAHEGIGIIADGDSPWHVTFPAGITFDGELVVEHLDEHNNVVCTDGSGVLDKTKWSVDKHYGSLLLDVIETPFVLVQQSTKKMLRNRDDFNDILVTEPNNATIFCESQRHFATKVIQQLWDWHLYPAHVEIKVDYIPPT